MLKVGMRKRRWVAHTKGSAINALKKNVDLESADSWKERKTEASLERDSFVGSRKMRQNMEQG